MSRSINVLEAQLLRAQQATAGIKQRLKSCKCTTKCKSVMCGCYNFDAEVMDGVFRPCSAQCGCKSDDCERMKKHKKRQAETGGKPAGSGGSGGSAGGAGSGGSGGVKPVAGSNLPAAGPDLDLPDPATL
jgi:uncharacterized membrane protein YgcG